MDLKLHVWRQAGPDQPGRIESYDARGISPDMSFLEMLDFVNEGLLAEGREPIAFAHDCREGICGTCSMMVNGVAHGPQAATAVCQLHMRKFKQGDAIWIEPWRAKAFPIVKDLVTDRSAFDRIMAAGGFISMNAGSAVDANVQLIPKDVAERSMDAAACIGCGACVAQCPNGSAMLFVAAKVAHLMRLPQGHPERERRVSAMVETMDAEGFGNCTNHYECMEACPKSISVEFIADLNREFQRATVRAEEPRSEVGGAG